MVMPANLRTAEMRRERVRALVARGYSVVMVAEALDITRQGVYGIMQQAGIPHPMVEIETVKGGFVVRGCEGTDEYVIRQRILAALRSIHMRVREKTEHGATAERKEENEQARRTAVSRASRLNGGSGGSRARA